MSSRPKLAIFDVDGTLVDSQAHILASMEAAYAAVELPRPERAEVLSIVGLSLPVAIARLVPRLSERSRERMVAVYKARYAEIRAEAGEGASPLFPGIAHMLSRLATRDDLLLGVATGKSKRGLDYLLLEHGLQKTFITCQVADFHPSKPHPSMVLTALSESGCAAEDAVMIGDTVFDLEMGKAAGVSIIGVDWGYHPREALEAFGPDALVGSVEALESLVLDRVSLRHE